MHSAPLERRVHTNFVAATVPSTTACATLTCRPRHQQQTQCCVPIGLCRRDCGHAGPMMNEILLVFFVAPLRIRTLSRTELPCIAGEWPVSEVVADPPVLC